MSDLYALLIGWAIFTALFYCFFVVEKPWEKKMTVLDRLGASAIYGFIVNFFVFGLLIF